MRCCPGCRVEGCDASARGGFSRREVEVARRCLAEHREAALACRAAWREAARPSSPLVTPLGRLRSMRLWADLLRENLLEALSYRGVLALSKGAPP